MTYSLLKDKNFRNYIFADIISMFGSGITFIAINWYVLELTNSNKQVGFIILIGLLAGLLASPFIGTVCDRYNRRQVLFLTNIAHAVAIILVMIVVSNGSHVLPALYALSAVSGIRWVIAIPASRALIQEIVGQGSLIEANSFIEISLQTGTFIASGCTGYFYKYFGFNTILLANALMFLVGNFFLLKIKYETLVGKNKSEGFKDQFVNAIKYLNANRSIFFIGIVMQVPLVATIASNAVLPGYVHDHLRSDAVVFGISDMIYGIGAFLSGFIVTQIVSRTSRFKTMVLFFAISSFSLFFLYFNRYAFGLYVAYIFFGLSNSSLRIVFQTSLMEIVPNANFGRCTAVWQTFSSAMQISSVFVLGHLMDKLSAEYGYLVLAAIMVAGCVCLMCVTIKQYSLRLSDAETTEGG